MLPYDYFPRHPEGPPQKMADLESVLADVSYLMAMERSKVPGVKTVRKFVLPDKRSAMTNLHAKALACMAAGYS